MMERAALERMIGRLKALPTPSVVHSRLAALLADPDCTFAEVSATVGLDQVLTAELFRAVNTPRPAATRISTVMQAVRLAGFGTLGALVSAQPIVPESADDGPGADARGLWRHALAVAIASRAIAAQTRYQDPEEWRGGRGVLSAERRIAIQRQHRRRIVGYARCRRGQARQGARGYGPQRGNRLALQRGQAQEELASTHGRAI